MTKEDKRAWCEMDGAEMSAAEPWLDWLPMATFPRDGEGYLVWDNRKMGGDPEVVFWDDEVVGPWCLKVEDGPHYHVESFTHWARIPGPQR